MFPSPVGLYLPFAARLRALSSIGVIGIALILMTIAGCKPSDSTTSSTDSKTSAESNQASSDPTPSQSSSKPSEAPAPSKNAAKETAKPVEERVAEATQLVEAGKLEEAWTKAKELLIAKPDDHAVLFLAARVLGERKEYKSAIAMLNKIPENDPTAGPAALGQSAQWLAEMGDLDQAEAKLLKLLKDYPTAVPAIRLLARIYNAQGRRFEAAKPLERLVRLGDFTMRELSMSVDLREPYDDEALRKAALQFAPSAPHSQLGEVRNRLIKNRWEEQFPVLSQIVQERPDVLEPWIWYGESLLHMDRLRELSDWLSKPHRSASKHPEYWYIIGAYLFERNEYEPAARAFIEAIERDRRHVPAYQGLADCLLSLDQSELALRTREYANNLARINDLIQQILMKHAGVEAYDEVSLLYGKLGDAVGEFGWSASAAVVKNEPITEAMRARQKELRSGFSSPIAALEGIDKNKWALPDIAKMEPIDGPSTPTQTVDSSIAMAEVTAAKGIRSKYDNGSKQGSGWMTVEGLGGGVSVLDYDNDGWPDLFFSQGGDSPVKPNPVYKPKQLYRSIDSAQFADVSVNARVPELGYGQGTGVVDVDQDGFSDLMCANIGFISLYRNQGDGTFEAWPLPQAEAMSLWNSSIMAADLNGDHLPDIIQGIYTYGEESITRICSQEENQRGISRTSCHPKSFPPGKNRILYNGGDGTWSEASPELLQSIRKGYTLGTLITNLDRRLGNEVFFANDVSPNHYLVATPKSDGGLEHIECAAARGVSVDSVGRAQACMGIACGDQNRDGTLDFIVTNFRNEVSTLYLQGKDGNYVDGTRRSRLGGPTLPWVSFGCQLSDLDNDGWLDFACVNGHIDDYRHENTPWHMPSQILKCNQGQFAWLQSPSPGPYFDGQWIGRGLQSLDYNRDGKMDLVATHLDRDAALLENQSNTNNRFVQLELIGTRSERDAFGAVVELVAGGEKWVATLAAGEGFFGSNQKIISLGVANHEKIDQLSIFWPDGSRETRENIATNRRHVFVQGLE